MWHCNSQREKSVIIRCQTWQNFSKTRLILASEGHSSLTYHCLVSLIVYVWQVSIQFIQVWRRWTESCLCTFSCVQSVYFAVTGISVFIAGINGTGKFNALLEPYPVFLSLSCCVCICCLMVVVYCAAYSYVGNLDPGVTEELLVTLFSQLGSCKGCKIIHEVFFCACSLKLLIFCITKPAQ